MIINPPQIEIRKENSEKLDFPESVLLDPGTEDRPIWAVLLYTASVTLLKLI